MKGEISTNLDTCFQEVLREELRLTSQRATLEEPKAFFTPLPADSALLAPPNPKLTKCYECKSFGHIAKHCHKKLVGRYCKRSGYLIAAYNEEMRHKQKKTYPNLPRQNVPAAFQAQAPSFDMGRTSS